MSTRREIVKRALDFLAGLHSQEWDMQLPIGRLLVGDFNVTKDEAVAATQDAQLPARCAPFQRVHGLSRWQLHATENGRSGDLFAAMGCTIDELFVPVGTSFSQRGMRWEQHDAVAAAVWIPYKIVPDAEPDSSRPVSLESDRHGGDSQASASSAAASSTGGAAQLASDDDGATQPVPASPTASFSSRAGSHSFRNARTYVNDWSVAAPFLFCAPDGGVAMVRRLRVGPVCCGARGRNFLEVMEIH